MARPVCAASGSEDAYTPDDRSDTVRCHECGRDLYLTVRLTLPRHLGARPRRLQRSRAKGWRAPAGAVYVGRPSQYGNPFHVDRYLDAATAVRYFRDNLLAPENAERLARIAAELRGKDLLCWCPPGAPCHADVLLELANR